MRRVSGGKREKFQRISCSFEPLVRTSTAESDARTISVSRRSRRKMVGWVSVRDLRIWNSTTANDASSILAVWFSEGISVTRDKSHVRALPFPSCPYLYPWLCPCAVSRCRCKFACYLNISDTNFDTIKEAQLPSVPLRFIFV